MAGPASLTRVLDHNGDPTGSYSWYGKLRGIGYRHLKISRVNGPGSPWGITDYQDDHPYDEFKTLKEVCVWIGEERLSRPRDSQLKKVYIAEDVVVDSGAFLTWEDLVAFVRVVEESPLWRSVLGENPQQVVIKKAALKAHKSSAYGQWWTVVFAQSKFHYSKHIVLHELSHLIVHKLFKGVAAHGAEFCGVLMMLTTAFRGEEVTDKLRRSFDLFGVKYDEYAIAQVKDAS